ncbi:MAG: EAL domain-containing protein [Alphaproteobacteria bacterium]|nr:EAL domain-containing protein [Alphaproteobacteria bacterium]
MIFDETRLREAVHADLGQVGLVWNFSDSSLVWRGNPASVLGLVNEEIPHTASTLKTLINPQDLPNLMTALQSHVNRLDIEQNEHGIRVSEPFRLRMRDGTHQKLRLEGRLALDEATGGAILSGLVMQDVELGDRGQLAGVMSGRTAIAAALEHILLSRSAAIRNRGYFMALGLDRVGLLNAAHGASFVDSVLSEVEKRLNSFLVGKAHVGRMSGDVYGLIFEDLQHAQADALAAALLQLFTSTPVMTLHGPVMIGLSIGGAALLTAEEKGSDVVARAEAALGEAKQKGRGRFIVSTPMHEKRDRARNLLEGGHAVYKALEEGRMRMAYQPVMDMMSGKVSFFECLIRMVDNEGKLVAAEKFIPSLEELGMMRLLDLYSLHSAIRELEGFGDIQLSVNVSNQSLIDASWLRAAVSLLSGKPHVANRLIIEITESSAMNDVDAASRVIRTLKDLGCRIALDDFGAGSTSFMQLKKLAVDIVKIDKAYIRDISDPINHLFVTSLLALANGMGLKTVAEGAETKEEAEMLKIGGISHVQGYAIGFPSIERLWLPKNHEQRLQKNAG